MAVDETGIAGALRALPRLGIQSLLLEGGAALHGAAWDADVVDYVQVYEAPVLLGAHAVPMLAGRPFASSALFDRTVTVLGPDVLTEGYVHRPH